MALTQQLHVKLSAKDATSIRKLARNAQVSVSDMVRTLIRRARVGGVRGQQAVGDGRSEIRPEFRTP